MKRVAMPALVLRKSALSGQPADCSSFLTDSSFHSHCL